MFIVLFIALFPTDTLRKCHWTYRLRIVRARVAHQLCCCIPKKPIWWKSWLLKERKGNRCASHLFVRIVYKNSWCQKCNDFFVCLCFKFSLLILDFMDFSLPICFSAGGVACSCSSKCWNWRRTCGKKDDPQGHGTGV